MEFMTVLYRTVVRIRIRSAQRRAEHGMDRRIGKITGWVRMQSTDAIRTTVISILMEENNSVLEVVIELAGRSEFSVSSTYPKQANPTREPS